MLTSTTKIAEITWNTKTLRSPRSTDGIHYSDYAEHVNYINTGITITRTTEPHGIDDINYIKT